MKRTQVDRMGERRQTERPHRGDRSQKFQSQEQRQTESKQSARKGQRGRQKGRNRR